MSEPEAVNTEAMLEMFELLKMLEMLEMLETLKMIETIIKDAKEKRRKRKKKVAWRDFSFIIMAYWINIGSRGWAIITIGLKSWS